MSSLSALPGSYMRLDAGVPASESAKTKGSCVHTGVTVTIGGGQWQEDLFGTGRYSVSSSPLAQDLLKYHSDNLSRRQDKNTKSLYLTEHIFRVNAATHKQWHILKNKHL